MKNVNYKIGAIKRNLGVSDTWKPGQLISEVNKKKIIKVINKPSKLGVAIRGLV